MCWMRPDMPQSQSGKKNPLCCQNMLSCPTWSPITIMITVPSSGNTCSRETQCQYRKPGSLMTGWTLREWFKGSTLLYVTTMAGNGYVDTWHALLFCVADNSKGSDQIHSLWGQQTSYSDLHTSSQNSSFTETTDIINCHMGSQLTSLLVHDAVCACVCVCGRVLMSTQEAASCYGT